MESASQQSVVAGTGELTSQIEALRAKNAELIAERRKDRENREALQQQIDDLRSAQESAKHAKLAESGEFKTLWEEAQQTVADLKQQLASKETEVEQIKQGYTQEQLRASAIAQLSSAGALAPDQLYRLVQENLRAKEGQPVAYVLSLIHI